MGRPRALSPEQALAVVAEARRGVPQIQIAQHFAVLPQLVSRIVTGQGYADVTGIKRSCGTGPGQEPCCADSRCQRCRTQTAREENAAAVRALPADVRCVACHSAICRTVGVVLNARFLVRCAKCDGRKK